jgi:hypothetical protein
MSKYTNHIKNRMQGVKQEVMELLKWTELEYCEFQEKHGRQYLQSYISKDPVAIDTLLATPIFWNWFKNQWLQRDQQFIKDAQVLVNNTATRRIMYSIHNDPEWLINDRYPTGLVMAEGYNRMIDQFNKTIKS